MLHRSIFCINKSVTTQADKEVKMSDSSKIILVSRVAHIITLSTIMLLSWAFVFTVM